VLFQDFPGPGIFKKKIQDFPGGMGNLHTRKLLICAETKANNNKKAAALKADLRSFNNIHGTYK